MRDTSFLALIFIGGFMMSAMFAYVAGSSFVLRTATARQARLRPHRGTPRA
jgi:hypothetical protein